MWLGVGIYLALALRHHGGRTGTGSPKGCRAARNSSPAFFPPDFVSAAGIRNLDGIQREHLDDGHLDGDAGIG